MDVSGVLWVLDVEDEKTKSQTGEEWPRYYEGLSVPLEDKTVFLAEASLAKTILAWLGVSQETLSRLDPDSVVPFIFPWDPRNLMEKLANALNKTIMFFTSQGPLLIT